MSRGTYLMLWIGIALAMLLAGSSDAVERRQLVNLSRSERDAVRGEMRQMLASVAGVVRAVASGDVSAVATSARASGMASAVDQRLEGKLPKAFLEMGERVHHGFDELADAAQAGAGKDDVIAKLADVTGTCVACHAVYRFVGTR